jgi:hypothetical protein
MSLDSIHGLSLILFFFLQSAAEPQDQQRFNQIRGNLKLHYPSDHFPTGAAADCCTGGGPL